MARPLRVNLEANLNVPVIQVSGDLIYGESLVELSEAAQRVVSSGNTRIVVDLTRLERADSAGIAALLNVRQMVGDCGHVFVLCPPPRVRQSLQMMRAEGLFEICADEAELRRHVASKESR